MKNVAPLNALDIRIFADEVAAQAWKINPLELFFDSLIAVTGPEHGYYNQMMQCLISGHDFHSLEAVQHFAGSIAHFYTQVIRLLESMEKSDKQSIARLEQLAEVLLANAGTTKQQAKLVRRQAGVVLSLVVDYAGINPDKRDSDVIKSVADALGPESALVLMEMLEIDDIIRKGEGDSELLRQALVRITTGSAVVNSIRKAMYRAAQQLPRGEQERVGRNDPCPCGSGKKYKKCCMESAGE